MLAHRAPNGIRTRATALKGRRPGPLDDGGGPRNHRTGTHDDGCSHRAPPEARKAYVTGHRIAKHVLSAWPRLGPAAVTGSYRGSAMSLKCFRSQGRSVTNAVIVSGLRRSWARTIDPCRVYVWTAQMMLSAMICPRP